jgi:hypothetical protein
MASTARWRRNLDLELDPLTISAEASQKVMQRIRAACREPSRHEPPAEPPKITLSGGWDSVRGKPIVRR